MYQLTKNKNITIEELKKITKEELEEKIKEIRRKREEIKEKKKIIKELTSEEEKYIRCLLFDLIEENSRNATLNYSLTRSNVSYLFRCSKGNLDGFHKKTLRDKTLDIVLNKCNCNKCKENQQRSVFSKKEEREEYNLEEKTKDRSSFFIGRKKEEIYERIANELISQGLCVSNYKKEIVKTVKETLSGETVADYIRKNGSFSPIIYSRPFRATGMAYIGQTFRDVRGDGNEHLKKLMKGNHHNRLLQKDFNQYGSDNFGECFVLEIIEYKMEDKIEKIRKKLFEREKYWIEFLEKAFGRATYNTKNLEVKRLTEAS
jgi:hypothetical protein